MGGKPKSFASYIKEAIPPESSYRCDEEPGTLFLYELVQLSDAVRHCANKFPKKKKGDYTKDSQESLYRLCAATHAAIMGHFEAFEKSMFSGLFEASRLQKDFDQRSFSKKLEKWNVRIDVERLHAYRGNSTSIGSVFADSLPGWHSAAKVNAYFKGVVSNRDFFSNNHIEDLNTLWQLRHSIVHTGGVLTEADAHKVSDLAKYGGKSLIIDQRFVDAVVRRMHRLVKSSVTSIAEGFREAMVEHVSDQEKAEVDSLFTVRSSRPSYLK
jgi:hypothetical protein